MSESFFGVDSGLPALGAGKYESLEAELLTDDIEDEYDALNDETFGGDLTASDDWEDDHNKFSQLQEKNKRWNSSPKGGGEFSMAISSLDKMQQKFFDELSSAGDPFPAHPDENELEQAISQLLVLDDELDDPAIMDVGRSKPVSVGRKSYFGSSPPPPAIIESDNVGSPFTNTIWTSALRSDSSFPTSQNLCSSPSLTETDLKSEDPCIVGVVTESSSKPSLLPSSAPLMQMQTVEEIEKQLLSVSTVLPGAKTLEEIERDLLPSRRRTSIQMNGLPAAAASPSHNKNVVNRSVPLPIQPRSPPMSTLPIDVGVCASPPSFLPMSPPIGTPPKMGLNPTPILIPSYHRRFVPRQVAFQQQPLLVGPRSQAYLGQPLLFPGRMSPPTIPMFGARSRFAYPVRYMVPPPVRHPLLGINQPRHPVAQRPRPQQGFVRHPSTSNGEVDEYANLMTAKEKEWLIKIQLLQLQTSNPYLDDYYHTTYMMKQKMLEKSSSSNSDEPKLLLPEMKKTETRIYTPEQYEGSLGKLQAVSVNYPRKIIDLEVMHPEDGESDQTIANKDLRKFRQVLLEIEKLYSVFLTIDDTEKKILALPKESHKPLEENKRMAISTIFSSISNAIVTDEKFIQVMGIRKGRNLILRCFSLFNLKERRTILCAILKHWTPIMKRLNHDQYFWSYLKYFHEMIEMSSFIDVIEFGIYLQNKQSENSLNSKSHFTHAVQSKFGLTIIFLLFCRAEEFYSNIDVIEDQKAIWSTIVMQFCEVFCSVSDVLIPKVDDKLKFSDVFSHLKHFSFENVYILEKKLRLAFYT